MTSTTQAALIAEGKALCKSLNSWRELCRKNGILTSINHRNIGDSKTEVSVKMVLNLKPPKDDLDAHASDQ